MMAEIVTPCMGVWIEMLSCIYGDHTFSVTPCMGVWIEITTRTLSMIAFHSHSLYGSVD